MFAGVLRSHRAAWVSLGKHTAEHGAKALSSCGAFINVENNVRDVKPHNDVKRKTINSVGPLGREPWYNCRSFCATPGPSPLQQTPGDSPPSAAGDSESNEGKELSRHVPLRSAHAIHKNIKISPKKLNMMAKVVRRLHVEDAVGQCDAYPKKAARIVRSAINSACHNAVKNHRMNFGLLHVDECFVTQGQHLKRVWFHGRGRAGMRKRYYSHLTVVVKEKLNPQRKVTRMASWMARNQGRRGRGAEATFVAKKLEPDDAV